MKTLSGATGQSQKRNFVKVAIDIIEKHVKMNIMETQQSLPAWLAGMNEEDLGFIRRFLLASGSLKQVAEEYDISYPTVRLRLDRLIEKIKLYEKHTKKDPFETLLRSAHIDGKIDLPTLTTLLTAYRKERNDEKE